MADGIQEVVFLLAAGGFFTYKGYGAYKNWMLIKDIPRSKVRSVAMGIVELHGKPRITTPLKAPVTGEDCVYWRYTIEEYRKSGKHSRWVTIYDAQSSDPFFLEDETGKILIQPQSAQFELDINHKYYSSKSLFSNKKASMLGLETQAQLSTSKGFNNRRHQIYLLKETDEFFVMGTAKTTPQQEVYVGKGENEKTFIIGRGTENKILKRLRTRWMLMGFGGIGAILLGIYILLLFLV